MNETIDPREKFSEENRTGEGGDRLQNEGTPAINKLKEGLRDNFLTILLGFVVIRFLAGYFISRPVLQLWNRRGDGRGKLNESDFKSKHTNNKAMEQTDIRTHRTPPCLAFADHMNRFIAGDQRKC